LIDLGNIKNIIILYKMGSEVVGFDENYSKQFGSMSGGKRKSKSKSKSKRSNGHNPNCGCPVCKNMRKGKKGGVLLVGGSKINPDKYGELKAAFDTLNADGATDEQVKAFKDALDFYVLDGKVVIDQELEKSLDDYISALQAIATIDEWKALDNSIIAKLENASVMPEDTGDSESSNSGAVVGPDLTAVKTSLEGVKTAIDTALGAINGMAGGVSYYHGGKKSKKVGRKSKKSGRKSKRR
jgi:hypothetical protein